MKYLEIMKISIVVVILLLIGFNTYSQTKSSSKFEKPQNLRSALNKPGMYGEIFANDIAKKIKLSETEFVVVKDSYNEYNNELVAARLESSTTIDTEKLIIEKRRDGKILKVLNKEQSSKYQEYVEVKKKNNNN